MTENLIRGCGRPALDHDTPTPERVTLTDAEMHRLDIAWDCGSDAIAAIEQILTDRRAAWEAEVRADERRETLLDAAYVFGTIWGSGLTSEAQVADVLRTWASHEIAPKTYWPDCDCAACVATTARIAGGDQ